MLNNKDWFTEFYPNQGLGFGLQIKQHLHHEVSTYATIDIYDTTHFGHLMAIDGVIMLTSRDNFLYHEMISHPALFSHPNPQQVVIIGGGDCGTLKAVLQHPIQGVKQVEIEERVTRLAEIYFPELCTSNLDPRAELIFMDGIRWMKEAPSQSVDVIIVDSTDPMGPAEGLFNLAFYTQCHRVLTSDGVFVQQSESPLIHQSILRDMRDAMRQAGFQDLLTFPFPQPVYPSGWHSVTLAAKKPLLASFRHDTALLNKLNTEYYQFALHTAALTPLPFLKKILGE